MIANRGFGSETHPRIFAEPLGSVEALSNVTLLTGLPRVRLLADEEGFIEVYHPGSSVTPASRLN